MDINGWLFLISRNKYLDYRTIVAPDFMVEANMSSLLSKYADGEITKEKTAYYREVYHPKIGELTLIFRVIEMSGKEINLDTDDWIKDSYGRNILVIEGIVLKGIVAKPTITWKKFQEIHEEVIIFYQQFWEVSFAPDVISSSFFDLKYEPGQEQLLKLIEIKPAGLQSKIEVNNNETKIAKKFTYKELSRFYIEKLYRGAITSISFHPINNNKIVLRNDKQLIQVYQLNFDKKNLIDSFGYRLPEILTIPCSVTFSPDGQSIATGYIERDICIDNNFVKIWNLDNNEEIGSFGGHEASFRGRITTVCFSPKKDDAIIVSGGKDRAIIIWDITSKGKREKLLGHNSPINSIVISSSGNKLISADEEGEILIWEIDKFCKSKLLKKIEADIYSISCLSITSNSFGDMFASSSGNIVKFWSVNSRRKDAKDSAGIQIILHREIRAHNKLVNEITFSPNGQYLASGSDDCYIRIWDTESFKCLATLNNTEEVTSIAFSADGQYLASGSKKGLVIIWRREYI